MFPPHGAAETDVKRFLDEAVTANDEHEKADLNAILHVSMQANSDVFDGIWRKAEMRDLYEEMVQEIGDERFNEGVRQGIEQGVQQNSIDYKKYIRKMADSLNLTREQVEVLTAYN